VENPLLGGQMAQTTNPDGSPVAVTLAEEAPKTPREKKAYEVRFCSLLLSAMHCLCEQDDEDEAWKREQRLKEIMAEVCCVAACKRVGFSLA